MRAALITELGQPPRLAERAEPDDQSKALVELRAAAINPVDLAVGSGKFPLGSPPVPYVPGAEGVGIVVRSSRFVSGTRVFACGGGLGVGTDGTFSERFLVPEAALVEVPDGIDDARAVAFGIPGLAAWLPFTWATSVQPGETVVILGASGVVGAVAIQAAKLLGGGRVVGVGRDAGRLARAREYGADAVVEIGPDLTDRLREACGEGGPTLILDALWGEPVVSAMTVAAMGARLVHVGQSAGPMATIPSGLVRAKRMHIIGFSDFLVPADAFASGYRELLGHVAAGRITLELETVPLAEVAAAWARQAEGGSKLVLVP